jgi:hypothetical protein
MRSIGFACLMSLMMLGATREAAASDADVIRGFGMVGRVAISCAGSPDASNPHMIYAISGAGAVTRTLRMDPSMNSQFVMQNLRLVGPDVLQYDETGGASAFTVSVLKQPDGSFRAWRSVRTSGPNKGEVLIENGKFKGGTPTQAFMLCDN